ncbi:MAG: autotransporter assembly complex family protein [Pseudomonadota bacterium]
MFCIRLTAAVVILLTGASAIAGVTITGVTAPVEQAIRAGLSLTDACEQPAWLVRYRFGTAEREIKTVLESYGYYSSEVSPRLAFTADCFTAEFEIEKGPPTLVTRSAVNLVGEGSEFGDFRRLVLASPLTIGSQFDHERYEDFKSDVEEVAARYGFLEGEFTTRQVVVDAVKNSAAVNLVYTTGRRFSFGETNFESDAIDQDLLARYLPYRVGDPFDAERLSEFYQSLLGSGYFDDVIVRPLEPDMEAARVPIEVALTSGRSTRTRIGLGVSTDLGPNVSLRRHNRLRNRRGHQTDLNAFVSPVRTELGGYYRIPQEDRANGWISVYGGYLLQDTDTSKSSSTTVGLRRISPRGKGWVSTRFIELTNDQFDLADASQAIVTLIPGINVAYTKTDASVARPQHAHRISLEVTGADKSLGSSVSFVSVTAAGKVVYALTDRLRVLARGRVGLTETREFARLPPRLRFFSGGDDRVRGFDYEEIGARDAAGNVIGGDRLLESSLELDYLIRPAWSVAAFVDAGSVSLSSFSLELERGVGIGVRWYSPVGPLRIDLAKALSEENGGIRLHFSLGPDV